MLRPALQQMTPAPLDLLVVGGGIVGSGVARDAAMRGLRTALIDRFDFAFGTSSRSSRLLHGGIRYLAQGRIGLVHEASTEKMTIGRIAPHLAQPLPFLFPTRKHSPWKLWKLRIGVKLYDLLCGGRNMGKSSSMNHDGALQLLPQLNPENLTGAVRYYDGLTNDARLVLDTLRSAHAHGALLSNYTTLEDTTRKSDGLWHCRVHDRLTNTHLDLTAKTVVNATGAWADTFPASKVALRLTKGVHLVTDRSKLQIPDNDAVVMAEGTRILFVIPWGHERLILGTTDTDYTGPVESPTVDDEDVAYILKVTNQTFPTAHLTQGDVISAWSGLRPLIAGATGSNGKPSDISRAHQILQPLPGWIDVAGGKLTTYRLMAEQTVNLALKHLNTFNRGSQNRAPATHPKSPTATTPLLERETHPQYSAITPPPVTRDAVTHYVQNEWAQHLDDVMIRRTSWRYYHRNHLEIAQQVANWMAPLLHWPPDTTANELARYTDLTTAHTPPAPPPLRLPTPEPVTAQ